MRQGQITVFFSLLLPLVLALIGAALESAGHQVMRSRIQRSLVLCEYSFLSEYQKELWNQYGVFYLDTGYGTTTESEERIEARLLAYLTENLAYEEGSMFGGLTLFQAAVSDLEISGLSRMTDEDGMGFYEQAVAFERNLWGADVLDSWMQSEKQVQELLQWEDQYSESKAREQNNLEILRQRRLEEEKVDTQDPTAGLRRADEGLLAMVLDSPEQLSAGSVSLKQVPSVRKLLVGSGKPGRYPGNAVNDQWFHTYLLERFTNAKVSLEQPRDGWLAYEVEYILAGKDSDPENLKEVVNRLVLLREGVNYAYLLTDEGRKQEAYTWAAVIAGLTFMPEIVDVLQQIILLAWAYGESVLDVRGLLQGTRVALVKRNETWKLPLSQLLFFENHLAEYDEQSETNGLNYEDYLRILLTMTGRRTKCLRCLDIVEGNMRMTEYGRTLYVDQCVDGLNLKVDIYYTPAFSVLRGKTREMIHNLVGERRIAYEW